ncbi:MAG: metalloregulator ArsR/SmtB family transcription factor [Oscillospiraceae bacterium]|jgi:DNA-binding transcriptional ArsR family regulator|nr:metalloregulator ArsR/SmtB family transcription factor [Oscillospiraceae bacterium]
MNEERDLNRQTTENLTIPEETGNKSELGEPVEVELPDEELLYELADLFKIFGDTTRIKILYALMNRPLNVGDLASLVGSSQSAVSHQLRTLKTARLVKFRRDGKNALYSLADDHVHTVLAQGMTHICE